MYTSEYLSHKSLSLFDQFSHNKLRSYTTKKSYFSEVNNFCDFVKKDLLSVTEGDCRSYVSHLSNRLQQGTLKETTRKKKVISLSSVFSYFLEEAKDLPSGFYNFFEHIPLPAVSENIDMKSIISQSSFEQLLSVIKDASYTDYVFVRTLYYGMMQLKHLLDLTGKDLLKDKHGEFALRVKKTPLDELIIKVPSFIIDDLMEVIGKRPYSERIFMNDTLTAPIAASTIQRHLRQYCQKAKLEKNYTFTQLRASAIYHSMTAGASDLDVMNQTGMTESKNMLKYRLLVNTTPIGKSASDFL